MTWIKTISVGDDEEVGRAVEAQRDLYPIEYSKLAQVRKELTQLWRDRLTLALALVLPVIGPQSLSLLNRISRRVSASRDSG